MEALPGWLGWGAKESGLMKPFTQGVALRFLGQLRAKPLTPAELSVLTHPREDLARPISGRRGRSPG